MDEKTIIKKNLNFFSNLALFYDNFFLKFWLTKFHNGVLNFLKNKNIFNKKILDVSCGTGELILKLKKLYPDNIYYGLDISKEMLNIFKKKLLNNELNQNLNYKDIKLIEGNVLDLPFEDNFFDFVFCTEAFHHYPNQSKALSEMYRVLKPNGYLIIVDIDFFFINPIFQKLEPGCVKINNMNEWKKLINQKNYKLIKQKRNWLFSITNIIKK